MLSALEMFSVGIGPSSSHTVGPMRAAKAFVDNLEHNNLLAAVERVRVDLYGSLSLTGEGHGTDRAAFAGLEGLDPATGSTDAVRFDLHRAWETGELNLAGTRKIAFHQSDIVFNMHESLPLHPNGMKFSAFDSADNLVKQQVMYSIGGGFIATQEELEAQLPGANNVVAAPSVTDDGFRKTGTQESKYEANREAEHKAQQAHTVSVRNISESAQANPSAAAKATSGVPYNFESAQELMQICDSTGLSIDEVVWANEMAMHSEAEVNEGLKTAWEAMRECVYNGTHTSRDTLPGILKVKRRAPNVYHELVGSVDVINAEPENLKKAAQATQSTCLSMTPGTCEANWISLFALAVNEENADGGRIVTAPTNGSAGIIPAVLHYYYAFMDGNWEGVKRFLLTAHAIGYLFKHNASISGAEVGCQGEVGSACSMAAAGLCAVMGGTPHQIENAAEIGIEHNLGLTCDPIAGLVQIPCIERNAIASNTAVNAARVSLLGDGSHLVSLDDAIATMKRTGADMMSSYKETSTGGLAVTVRIPEC